MIDRYLRTLAADLARLGYRRELLIMQGNGGTMSVDVYAAPLRIESTHKS